MAWTFKSMLVGVTEFFKKNEIPTQPCVPRSMLNRLEFIGDELIDLSKSLLDAYGVSKELRLFRAHLELEETGELLIALAHGDEQGVLDALADKQYILLGHAISFDLPLEAAFSEVHRSNMSKERQPTDTHGERVKDKGPNYSPPDLEKVLDAYRGRNRPARKDNLGAATD